MGRRSEPDWDAEARDFPYWDDEECDFVQVTHDEGRDLLTLHFLEQGDPRPLIHFLKNDHQFGPRVRNCLAWMLDDSKPYPPFQFVVERRRNRSRRKKPFPVTAGNKWRDRKLALRVYELVHKGVRYEQALEQTAQEFGTSDATVKKAYARILGKRKR
jgi:hypothetical protein